MAKKKTRVALVLDESGSMIFVKNPTMSGFNEYVDTLKANSKRVRFTAATFNSFGVEFIYDGVKPKHVKPLTDKTYVPRGTTPLYDAIGKTIAKLEESSKKRDDKLVVIQTDGEENSSSEYNLSSIKALIADKQAQGWTFIFMGADIDAYAASGSMGISRDSTLEYTGSQTKGAFDAVSRATKSYLSTNMREGFFDDVPKTNVKSTT